MHEESDLKILVTGAAGFIGYHTALRFLKRGDAVVGLDNLNAYYDPRLKHARLDRLRKLPGFSFEKIDLADAAPMAALFERERFDRVVHLAAQAGVRYSLEDPASYVMSNVLGTVHVLEGARRTGVAHVVYASTSSVYGASTRMPFDEHDPCTHVLSPYAATKRGCEHLAHSWSAIYGLPTTGLRFFTVYGPWGRPDMALFKFADAILAGRPIDVFNHGHHKRDFTYVEDIAEGVERATDRTATPDPQWNSAQPDPATSPHPWRLYNIGSNRPVPLMRYIELLEQCLGRKAKMNMLPKQPGDVEDTWANVGALAAAADYRPSTPVETGVANFVRWYCEYHGVSPAG